MANRLVVGMQWGDEGKGKIVDLLSLSADWVARYSGGANAGHTVKIGEKSFALHLVPTGILAGRTRCLIGNGVVLDLPAFFAEIEELKSNGVDFDSRLFVSASVHLVLPHHRLLEARVESGEIGTRQIGTTMRGIGPAYADKIARRGVRAVDLLDTQRLTERVGNVMQYWETIGGGYLAANGCTAETVVEGLLTYRRELEPMLVDASAILESAVDAGQTVLFEGAQGAMLDIDFGTYPFVTSSNTTTGGVFTGLGVSPRMISDIIGVTKAYTTRVGNGPFPTEVHGADSDRLRSRGREFGATTGRPRRCGWLDLVALKYATRLNGTSHVAITKLDVLDGFEEIPVCVGYRIGDEEFTTMPMDITRLQDVEPVYRMLPGWTEETAGITDFEELPSAAKQYLRFICDQLAVKLLVVSTGPERDETIYCDRDLQPAGV